MKKNHNAFNQPEDQVLRDLSDLVSRVVVANATEAVARGGWWPGNAELSSERSASGQHNPGEVEQKVIINVSEGIANDKSIRNFLRHLRQAYGTARRPLLSTEVAGSSDRFVRFLRSRGWDDSESKKVGELHKEFVKSEMPQMEVLSAVQELRDQFHNRPVEGKRPYLGKRNESEFPDPQEFLFHMYGDEIRLGRLTTGRLQEVDPLLYQTLYQDPELRRKGVSVVDLVEPKGKPYAKRVRACAELLGTESIEDAARFFGGIRADRVAKYQGR